MSAKVDQILKEQGVDEIRFYYKNCPFAGNIFTTCVLISKDKKILSRGVAICSLTDFHFKKKARKESRDRAIEALFTKKNTKKIRPEARKDDGFVQNCYKIKTRDDMVLIEQANKLNFHCTVRNQDSKSFLYVRIPYNYPIAETWKYFKYKSEFNPIPTEDEKHAFKVS